jgi:hypothetical protein
MMRGRVCWSHLWTSIELDGENKGFPIYCKKHSHMRETYGNYFLQAIPKYLFHASVHNIYLE